MQLIPNSGAGGAWSLYEPLSQSAPRNGKKNSLLRTKDHFLRVNALQSPTHGSQGSDSGTATTQLFCEELEEHTSSKCHFCKEYRNHELFFRHCTFSRKNDYFPTKSCRRPVLYVPGQNTTGGSVPLAAQCAHLIVQKAPRRARSEDLLYLYLCGQYFSLKPKVTLIISSSFEISPKDFSSHRRKFENTLTDKSVLGASDYRRTVGLTHATGSPWFAW